jgi:hypothetical protein
VMVRLWRRPFGRRASPQGSTTTTRARLPIKKGVSNTSRLRRSISRVMLHSHSIPRIKRGKPGRTCFLPFGFISKNHLRPPKRKQNSGIMVVLSSNRLPLSGVDTGSQRPQYESHIVQSTCRIDASVHVVLWFGSSFFQGKNRVELSATPRRWRAGTRRPDSHSRGTSLIPLDALGV